MTVNELIEKLTALRDGKAAVNGESQVTLVNYQAPDDYWITPVEVVDYDCFHSNGPWIVELKTRVGFNSQDSDHFSDWLDGEREDF